MSIPRHVINIWKKPRQAIGGTSGAPVYNEGLQAQYTAYAYEHTYLAVGGADTARCTVAVTPLEGDEIYWNYVGNRVTITVDNPIAPIFEGYIESVAIADGATKRVRSIADMANAVSVTYFAGGASAQATMATDAASVAEYGTKQKTFDAGNKNASGAAFATALRNRKLADLAQPLESFAPNSGGGFSIDITMKGLYHTFDWLSFEVSNTTFAYAPPAAPATLEDANVCVARFVLGEGLLPDVFTNPNGSSTTGNGNGIFYNDLDASSPFITTAAGWSRTKERRGGQTASQYLQETVEAGDGTNRRVIGITSTNFSTGLRTIYYVAANTDVEYTTDPAGTSRILDTYSKPVRAWVVRPDRQIRIVNASVGRSFAGTNTKYISKVQYKSESQEIIWTTESDLTLDGTLGIGTYTKTAGSAANSAQPRQFY